MRKLQTPNKAMTLYLPHDLAEALDQYMLDHYGTKYGKNEVVNELIRDLIEKEKNNGIRNTDNH